MMKLPSRPVRLAIMSAAFMAFYKARVDAASLKRAITLSNDAHNVLISSVISHIEKNMTSWLDMLGSMNSILDESHFAKVPALFSVGLPALVERVEVSVRSNFDKYVDDVESSLSKFLGVNLGVTINLVVAKLREEIKGYTSDHEIIVTFEKNVSLVEDSIVDSTRAVLVASSTARLAKLRAFFEDVLSWKLKSYERFLRHTSRIRLQLNPGYQLVMWVELSTQGIFGSTVHEYLTSTLFEEYMGNSSAFIELLDSKFSDVSVSDFSSSLDSFFRGRAGKVSTIIKSQYAQTYLLQLDAVDADSVLDEPQKKVLKTFAMGVRQEAESSSPLDFDSVPFDQVQVMYLDYANRLLREVRVLILVAFLEYESISLRAVAEGRQTCIVQFYGMRRAIDRAFFFEYSRERSFDLDLTASDFSKTLADSLGKTRETMLSLVDTTYIHFLFDEVRSFLLSRLTAFFSDDIKLLPLLKPMLDKLHASYADIIPLHVQGGIDLEHGSEESQTQLYVDSAFGRFLKDMEFSFTLELINGSKTSILEDLVSRLEVFNTELSSLPTELSRDILQIFNSDYFATTTESFITDDEIDYIGMKQYVVDETVSHASLSVESTRTSYKASIDSLFEKVSDFIELVSSDLSLAVEGTSRQDSGRREMLFSSLEAVRSNMFSFSDTLKGSTNVLLEQVLQSTIEEVQDAQRVRLYNYFNTKIQLIKDDFIEQAVKSMVTTFEAHVDVIEDKMLELSSLARVTFREHVDKLFSLEQQYRSEVAIVSKPFLDEEVVSYLEQYNIVSFSAKESIFKADMRSIVNSSAAEVILQRRLAVTSSERSWSEARAGFERLLFEEADASKKNFRTDLLKVIASSKSLAFDIMGQVDEVLDALDREIYTSIYATYEGIIDSVVGSTDNNLPESLQLTSVVFTPGIMDLTESPEIPADAFKRGYREPDDDTLYDESGNVLPEVDGPSGFTTNELVMLLLDWDLWLKGKIDEIVQAVVISMNDELIQNTCRSNKPPCREGWVEYKNIPWDVPCCRFDPVAQGFWEWETAGMLAKELFLGLVLDLEMLLETAADLADEAVDVGYKVGKKAKSFTDDIAKYGSKGLKKMGNKTMAKSFTKFAGKNPARMTKAIKYAAKMGGKELSKVGVKISTKVAVKVGSKTVMKGFFGAALKGAMSGPAGIALFIFDAVSLILDLWDPAGYNEQQTAALMKVERDAIEEYYKTELHNSGFDSPILADPMFDMSPGQKQRLWHETYSEWHSDRLSTFMSANEERFDLMADWESQNEVLEENDNIARELDENPNLLTTLVVQKLENVFLQDVSVRDNHKNPHMEDLSHSVSKVRTHVRQDLPPSGLLEIVLNETGVRAFNNFATRKAAFLNSFKWNPMYRFVKRKHDYMITKDCEYGGFLKNGKKCEIEIRQTPGTYSSSRNPYYEYETIEDCVRPAYPLLTPTLEGSVAFANALPVPADGTYDENWYFAREIRREERLGWVLNKVDAEEEFWIQYDPSLSDFEMVTQLSDRSAYQKTHEKLAKALQYQYERDMDTVISTHVDVNLRDEADPWVVSIADIKVIHLAQFPENWSGPEGQQVLKYPLWDDIDDSEKRTYTQETLPVVPSWVPPYQEMFDELAVSVEAGYVATHAENMRLIGLEYEEVQAQETIRLTEKAVKEFKSVEEILSEESVQGRSSEPDPPDFAVFLNGYGQSSPLYSIANECRLMGHGVSYDATKGLCNFTESYCKRYGVDFFYNSDLGVYDCEMSRSQEVMEYIFGTTVTRSVKRGWRATDNKGKLIFFGYLGTLGSSLGTTKIGACRRALGSAKVNGVEVKQVQNGDNLNYVDTATTLEVIGTLGLSGF